MPKDEMDPEDPMELVGIGAPSGFHARQEAMLEALIEEFLMEGFDKEGLIAVFREPFYQMTHDLYIRYGEAYLAETIDRVLAGLVGRAA